MATENFPISLDVLPVAAPTKPSQRDTPTSRDDAAGGGFRELLSDSLDDGRGRDTRQTDRRDAAHSSAAAETPPSNQMADSVERREPNATPKSSPADRPENPSDVDVPVEKPNSPEASDAAEPADLTDKLDHASDQAVVGSHAAEGTPPAEFVAALLATNTATTTTTTAESDSSSYASTTITVQSPPHGLVTALATQDGSATGPQNQSSAADSPETQDASGTQTANGEQVAASAAPAQEESLLPATSSTDGTQSVTLTQDSTTSTKANQESPQPKPSATESAILPQDNPDEDTSQSTPKVGVTPAEHEDSSAKNNSQQVVTKPPVVGVPETAVTNPETVVKDAPPPDVAAVGSSEATKAQVDDESVPSRDTQPPQTVETSGNDQQPEGDSSDQPTQRQPADSEVLKELGNRTAAPAGTQQTAVAADDPIAGSETADVTVSGPAPAPQQHETARTNPLTTVGSTESAVDVERPDFATRVAQAVRTSADNRQQVTLRLTPPELGALRIEVAVDHGKVSARIDAQTAAAQKVLMDNLPQLKEALTQHGASIERLEVGLTDNSPDDRGAAMGQGFAGQKERGDAPHDESVFRRGGYNTTETEESADIETPAAPAAPQRRAMTELDVTI